MGSRHARRVAEVGSYFSFSGRAALLFHMTCCLTTKAAHSGLSSLAGCASLHVLPQMPQRLVILNAPTCARVDPE